MEPSTRSPVLPHPCPYRLLTVALRGVVPRCPQTRDHSHDIRFIQVKMPTLVHMTRILCHHGEGLTCNLGNSMTRVPQRP